jgi:hypothetical protein
MTERSGHDRRQHDGDMCPPCPQHSGLETWVKIGMAGITCNILLLLVNITINITLNTTVASIQTRQMAVMDDIREMKKVDKELERRVNKMGL